jgi:hypothetical protein
LARMHDHTVDGDLKRGLLSVPVRTPKARFAPASRLRTTSGFDDSEMINRSFFSWLGSLTGLPETLCPGNLRGLVGILDREIGKDNAVLF